MRSASIAALLVLLAAGPATAQSRGREVDVSAARIRQLATDAVEEALPRGVELSSLEWSRPVRLPRGSLEARARVDEGSASRGRMRATVEILVDGDEARTIRVSLRVRDRRLLLVAVRELRPGDRVSPRDVELREAPPGARFLHPLRSEEDAVGLVVARLVEVGEVVEESSVRTPAAVQRGERVHVLARVGGVTVTAQGEPLEDGLPGDVIRVVCLPSRRTVDARVVGPGRVEVTR